MVCTKENISVMLPRRSKADMASYVSFLLIIYNPRLLVNLPHYTCKKSVNNTNEVTSLILIISASQKRWEEAITRLMGCFIPKADTMVIFSLLLQQLFSCKATPNIE